MEPHEGDGLSRIHVGNNLVDGCTGHLDAGFPLRSMACMPRKSGRRDGVDIENVPLKGINEFGAKDSHVAREKQMLGVVLPKVPPALPRRGRHVPCLCEECRPSQFLVRLPAPGLQRFRDWSQQDKRILG